MFRTLILSNLVASLVVLPTVADTGVIHSKSDIIEELFAAFNAHDVEALSEFYTEDAIVYSPESCEPTIGPDAIAAGYAAMFQQIPDVYDTLELVVVEGDRAAVTFIASGTVENQPFELPIAAFLLFEDGKIKEDRVFFDTDIEQDCET